MEALAKSPTVALPIVGFVLWVCYKFFLQPNILPDLPIAGYDKAQWFAWPKLLHRSFHNYRHIYTEAYENHLSHGKPCIMPEFNDSHVVLPSSLGQWLVDQPDAVLSSQARQNDFLQTRYTFPIPKMSEKPHHAQVVKTDLTRRLSTLTKEIWEELGIAFDEHWGTDAEEWKEVNVFQTMMRIVTRTSNRLFVGPKMCTDPRYLELCMSFAQDVPLAGIVIRMVPRFLQPLLAPIITLPNRYHNNEIRKFLRPEITRRLQIAERGDEEEEAPNDFLQWFITYARKSLEPEESTPKFLSDRIATVNFAAIHTSTFTSVNAIYDIVSSPDMNTMFDQIREETAAVVPQNDEKWNRASVTNMVKTDAILRESMRRSSFMTDALTRTVVAKSGITTPDGLHIKKGNVVAVPALPVHMDPKTYTDPTTFVPARFLRTAEADSEKQNGDTKMRSTNTVDTSLIFLPFGHGRHGCPGRFFAANEMKLLLAYMAVNYEVEPLRERPEPIAFGSVMTPNPNISIRVRRRRRRRRRSES